MGMVGFQRLSRTPAFAWICGVLLPPVVFWIDRGFAPPGLLEQILPLRPYATILAFLSIAVLVLFLLTRGRPRRWHAFLVGPLGMGFLFACVFATFLVPLSLLFVTNCLIHVFSDPLGALLLSLLGSLGLVPLVTAIAFLHASSTAVQSARSAGSAARLPISTILGIAFLGLALGLGRVTERIERRQTAILLGDAAGARSLAEHILRFLWVFPQVRLDELEDAAWLEHVRSDQPVAGPVEQAYERITAQQVWD